MWLGIGVLNKGGRGARGAVGAVGAIGAVGKNLMLVWLASLLPFRGRGLRRFTYVHSVFNYPFNFL